MFVTKLTAEQTKKQIQPQLYTVTIGGMNIHCVQEKNKPLYTLS